MAAAKREGWLLANRVRDSVIAEYDQRGVPLRKIAAWSGLHPSTVQQIIAAQTAERQARTAHALHLDPRPDIIEG